MRLSLSAGCLRLRNSEAAVRLNPNRHLSADKIETLSPDPSGEKNFGPKRPTSAFGALCNNCTVSIAHDDIA